jgi:hypothetical protein
MAGLTCHSLAFFLATGVCVVLLVLTAQGLAAETANACENM